MTRNGIRRGQLAYSILGIFGSLACSGEDVGSSRQPEEHVGSTARTISYEEFKERYVTWDEQEQRFVVESDIAAGSEDELRKFYASRYGDPGALIIGTSDVGGQNVIKWSDAQKRQLSYCIGSGFSDTAWVRAITDRASADWERAADIHFIHDASQDGAGCDNRNNRVLFNVRPWDEGASRGFFPNSTRDMRELMLPRSGAAVGPVRHEMGHVLGFHHEQYQQPGTTCPGPSDGGYQSLTEYDSYSVMHYRSPFCNSPVTSEEVITRRDQEGALRVYDAPTNVIATVLEGGQEVINARKYSPGKQYHRYIYKWVSGTSWQRISDMPFGMLAAFNSNLYAMDQAGVYKYSGSGTSWTTIRAARVAEIFPCVGIGQICAIKPNTTEDGKTIRYTGSGQTWEYVLSGERLRSYVPVNGNLSFFIRDESSNSGQVMRVIGMIGVTPESVGTNYSKLWSYGFNSVFAEKQNTGDLHWFNTQTSAFEAIDGPFRHLATPIFNTYMLARDGSSVLRWKGRDANGVLLGWETVGGPAVRIFGNAASLYMEDSSGTIYKYNNTPNSWTSLGKP